MSEFLFYAVPFLFIGIVIYIFRPSAKKSYQEDGEIPFKNIDKEKELEKSSSNN